jgi:hypothetical protein
MRTDRQCDLRFWMDVQRVNDPLLYFAALVPETLTPEHWKLGITYRLEPLDKGRKRTLPRPSMSTSRPRVPQVAGVRIVPMHLLIPQCLRQQSILICSEPLIFRERFTLDTLDKAMAITLRIQSISAFMRGPYRVFDFLPSFLPFFLPKRVAPCCQRSQRASSS